MTSQDTKPLTVDTSTSPSPNGSTPTSANTRTSPTKASGPTYAPSAGFAAYFKKPSESNDMIKQSAEDLRQSIAGMEVTELTPEQIQAKADLAALEILGSKKGTVAKAMTAGQSRYASLMASYRPTAGA